MTDRTVRVKLDDENVRAPLQRSSRSTPVEGQAGVHTSPNEDGSTRYVCRTLTIRPGVIRETNLRPGWQAREHILNQVVRKVVGLIKKKKKVDVRPATEGAADAVPRVH